MEDIAVRSTFAPAFGRGHEHPLSEGGMSTWTVWRGMDEGLPCFLAWRRGVSEKTLKKVAGKFGRE